jgi:hypothetical protein
MLTRAVPKEDSFPEAAKSNLTRPLIHVSLSDRLAQNTLASEDVSPSRKRDILKVTAASVSKTIT